MVARAQDDSLIPSAPLDDLDLDREEDRAEWERRLMELAAKRIAAARARLERLNVVDADGNFVSDELAPDMLPDSEHDARDRLTRACWLLV
jgi:hypothetical protein